MNPEYLNCVPVDCIRMHGAGNSFVMIDNRNGGLERARLGSLAEQLCGKYRTDGILVTMPCDPAVADFGMLYYNADGSLGEMCGNGARCIARYGVERGLAEDPEHIRILATAGVVEGRRITEELYEVRLNDPSVAEAHRTAVPDPAVQRKLPADPQTEVYGEAGLKCSDAAVCTEASAADRTGIARGPVDCGYVELGDPGIPHAVMQVPADAFKDLDALREFGRGLRYAAAFPKGANVTFACRTGENAVRAITFERGVEDFTLACGTGCGATAVVFALRGLLSENRIEIDMPGGRLSVRFNRENDRITNLRLTGPTAYITE